MIDRDTQKLLVETLARTHALWMPWRKPEGRNANGEARSEFREKGLRWTPTAASGDSGESGRARSDRLMSSAEAAGLIRTHTSEGRRSHLRLSDTGEAEAHALAGLPPFAECAAELARFRRLHAACGFDDAGLSDIMLLGKATKGAKPGAKLSMMSIEQLLAPALTRGIITTGVTMSGICWWFIHNADDLPTLTAKSKRTADCACDYYDALEAAERSLRATPARAITIPPSSGLDYSKPRRNPAA